MRAVIDSSITVDVTSIPPLLLAHVTAELSTRNPDKDRALSEMIREAKEMPDELRLWCSDGHKLSLPRGYAHRLEQVAQGYGEGVEWDARMVLAPASEHCFRDWRPLELRGYQEPARDAMLDWAQGVVQAPTGSGKSATALEFVRWAGQRALIVVGKTALARQWQAMIREHYGYEAGYIGEGTWEEADITVALWQTLWTQKDIYPEFWAKFGTVVWDEVHHLSAMALSELAERFPAFYRIGLSATPRWDPLLFPIVEAVVGPIIHVVEHSDVGDDLVTPTVRSVETCFEAVYKPTRFEGGRRVQNNFSEVMSKLVVDPLRNDLIVKIAREEAQAGHHVLVVTRRIEHVKQIIARLEKTLKVGRTLHALTGSQTGHDAQRIAKAIGSSDRGTVLVSTVADEALDIPRLDRLVMAFPLRRLPLVEQQVGRIMRPAPGKSDAVIYDVSDNRVGVLKSQSRDRTRLYLRRGWALRHEQEESEVNV